MSLFYLDVRKTVQAVGVVLSAVAGREQLEYIAIIKLLYLADRESWKETGSSITGDAPCAMKNGPVLSGVFDLVKLQWERDLAYWVEFIHREDYDLVLKSDPGTDLLSDYEVEKLTEIARRHKRDSWRKLIDITHKLPEWIENDPAKNGCNMKPIPLEDILRAVGREMDIEEIKKDAASSVAMHQTFGR
jgi:uncharacterized phage-associated protein